jgi:DNA-directed RNA polymerase subunit RPC12/RpoP
MVWRGVYVDELGTPIKMAHIGGIGVPFRPPPGALAFPILFGSDSEGQFGHVCPACKQYWRGESFDHEVICPYCGTQIDEHLTLTEAHRVYARRFAELLSEALSETLIPPKGEEPEVVTKVMNFDLIADEIAALVPRPDFYYVEEGQQHQYTCARCGAFNDVMGHAAYCSACGSRNDARIFRERLAAIRASLHSGGAAEDALKAVISAFDGSLSLIVQQLLARVPLLRRARGRFERANHDLEAVAEAFDKAFEIDPFEGIANTDRVFIKEMTWRRHVHEHNAGIADQAYLDRTSNSGVRLGQQLNESVEDVQNLSELLSRMLDNIATGFAELFPPRQPPIAIFENRRLARRISS